MVSGNTMAKTSALCLALDAKTVPFLPRRPVLTSIRVNFPSFRVARSHELAGLVALKTSKPRVIKSTTTLYSDRAPVVAEDKPDGERDK